jgi:hypothetical protein
MNKLFQIVEQVRKYGKKEIPSDKLTIDDCLYLYEHGIDMHFMQIDNNKRICILKPHFERVIRIFICFKQTKREED